MAKDAYYFTHDSNASEDPKILQMCSVYKAEGYGWYWMIIEQMRQQADYKLHIGGKYALNAFALRFYADAKRFSEFIEDCINEFNLFKRDGDLLYSESLIRRMAIYDDKSEKARVSALIRWGKQPQNNANAMQTLCDGNASKVNKSKVNKSKVKDMVPYHEKYRLEFSDLPDFDTQVKNCEAWHDEHHPTTANKHRASALRNWLTKEREYRSQRNGGNGEKAGEPLPERKVKGMVTIE